MAAAQDRTDSVFARPSLIPELKVVAGLVAALMLVQAFLAGQGWF